MSGQREKRPESGRKPRARAIFRHLYSQRDWSDRRWRAGRELTDGVLRVGPLSLRMLGFTLWRQRWAHCWPVRPGISSDGGPAVAVLGLRPWGLEACQASLVNFSRARAEGMEGGVPGGERAPHPQIRSTEHP